MTPRQCQTDAMRAYQYHAKLGTQRVLLQLATGSGKGDIIAGLLTRCAWAGKRGLFVVARDFLLDDVYNRTIEVEPAMYAGRVKGRINECDRSMLFASLQTVCNEERCRMLGAVDLLVVDEVHGLLCPSGETLLATLLDMNPNMRIAGFTATAYRSAGGGRTSGLGAMFGPEVGGTDEPICTYSLADGIRDGVLCPIRGLHMRPLIDDKAIDVDDTKTTAEILDTPAHNNEVVSAYLDNRAEAAIAFCVDVGHAIHLAEAFNARGVKAAAVWETSTKKDARTGIAYGKCKDRDAIIARALAGEIEVLTNMNLLSTGFDWRACAVGLDVSPTSSPVLHSQRVGRITRYVEGKEGLWLDFCGNASRHDLGLGADFSAPSTRVRTFDIGDTVRHRFDIERSEGAVTDVEEEGARCYVEWRGAAGEEWNAADDLVLVRKRREREEVTIAPTVTGLDPYPVLMIRSGAMGWYEHTYTETIRPRGQKETTLSRKVYTAKADLPTGETKIHVRRVGECWDVWAVVDTAQRVSDGHASAEDAMASASAWVRGQDGRVKPVRAEWKTALRSDKLAGYLRYLGLRRDTSGMTMGEASALADTLVCLDALDPARKVRREMNGKRFGKGRATG